MANVFLPGVGCALYLYHNFYNRGNIESLSEGVKNVVNSNYKLEQLEKAHRLSDNITNKTNLAAGYATYGRYTDAINLYKECLTGFMADDPTLTMKLLQTYFLNKDYQSTIEVGEKLKTEKTFQNAEERIAYAWSLHHCDKTALAEKEFESMDKTFSNYKHRMEYCKFLLATNKPEAFNETKAALLQEFELMKGFERKFNRDIIRDVKELNLPAST